MPAPLSDEIVEQGRVLRNSGLGWSTIARRLGLSATEGIQRRLDPDFHKRRNEYQAARARLKSGVKKYTHPAGREKVDPAETVGSASCQTGARPTQAMIDAAARRLLANRTITASLMGDPPPGHSALDKRMGA